MTIWTPDLSARKGPRYMAIADALATDVGRGILASGTRLPTHRDLAYRLGITVGTVSRAYAEAARRGLTSGVVGRGTYVRGEDIEPDSTPELVIGEDGDSDLIDFSLNLPVAGEGERILARALGELANSDGLGALMEYQPDAGMGRHRAAGAAWLAESGVEASLERVVVTNGAQNGIAVTFAALARPGDTVLTESVTYPGMKEFAAHMNLTLRGLEMDDDGIRPDSLIEACVTGRPRALYCMPNLQNPTTRVMPESRRREIAGIARRHDLLIVEDDVYGFLLRDRPPPLAAIAPDITVFVTSMSKSLATGLRVGYVHAPEDMARRIAATVRSDCRMATPLPAELVSRWIADGTARRMARWQHGEAVARQAVARRVLDGIAYETHRDCYHLWLPLPEPWRAADFAAQVRARNVAVIPAEAFAAGRGQPPHAVRICLGAVRTRERMEAGLRVIAETLGQRPQPSLSVI